MDDTKEPRKRPVQARAKQTVEWILEGAARVFRREGFDATTNRIAREAGVSIGTLYEYFPNKTALLVALADLHLETAERGVLEAIERGGADRELLGALQRAICASHRYPSGAIDLVREVPQTGEALQVRVLALRARVMAALRARTARLPDPDLRARAIFGAIAELSSRAVYESGSAEEQSALADLYLAMASRALEA
jgi:AcrR family transcriptional regulator